VTKEDNHDLHKIKMLRVEFQSTVPFSNSCSYVAITPSAKPGAIFVQKIKSFHTKGGMVAQW
jgi:hypothetical protein